MSRNSSRIPLYSQVHDYLLDHIQNGKWRDGSRVPSETKLAEQFGVSRITVKSALQKLVDEGLVYRIRGSGTFVSGSKEGEPIRYRSAAKQLVAFIIPRLDNRFTTSLLRGAEKVFSREGIHPVLFLTEDCPKREEELLKEAVRMGVSGIVIYPAEGQQFSEQILRLTLDRFPIVVIDRYIKGLETNSVCSDHRGGAFEATKHLLELGHRHIAFATSGSERTTSLEERLEGYKQALAEFAIPFDTSVVLDEVDPKQVGVFLAEHPEISAVFSAHIDIVRSLMDTGKAIPEQLALICFDDYEYSDLAKYPPTCMVQQEETIGAEAAKLLLALIQDPERPRQSLRIPTKLIVRGTT